MFISVGCLISWFTTINLSVFLFNPNLHRFTKDKTWEIAESFMDFVPVSKQIEYVPIKEYVTVKEFVYVPVQEFKYVPVQNNVEREEGTWVLVCLIAKNVYVSMSNTLFTTTLNYPKLFFISLTILVLSMFLFFRIIKMVQDVKRLEKTQTKQQPNYNSEVSVSLFTRTKIKSDFKSANSENII